MGADGKGADDVDDIELEMHKKLSRIRELEHQQIVSLLKSILEMLEQIKQRLAAKESPAHEALASD